MFRDSKSPEELKPGVFWMEMDCHLVIKAQIINR